MPVLYSLAWHVLCTDHMLQALIEKHIQSCAPSWPRAQVMISEKARAKGGAMHHQENACLYGSSSPAILAFYRRNHTSTSILRFQTCVRYTAPLHHSPKNRVCAACIVAAAFTTNV